MTKREPIEAVIARSSLGTPAVQRLARRAPTSKVNKIVRHVNAERVIVGFPTAARDVVTAGAPIGTHKSTTTTGGLRVAEKGSKMAPKKSSGGNARSAITGRYVKPSTAKRNPKTTVVERSTKKSKKGK